MSWKNIVLRAFKQLSTFVNKLRSKVHNCLDYIQLSHLLLLLLIQIMILKLCLPWAELMRFRRVMKMSIVYEDLDVSWLGNTEVSLVCDQVFSGLLSGGTLSLILMLDHSPSLSAPASSALLIIMISSDSDHDSPHQSLVSHQYVDHWWWCERIMLVARMTLLY